MKIGDIVTITLPARRYPRRDEEVLIGFIDDLDERSVSIKVSPVRSIRTSRDHPGIKVFKA